MSGPRIAVILPAGGSGVRAGFRKQHADLCGRPVLAHAIEPFLSTPGVEWIVIALPADEVALPPAWLAALDERIQVVAGGNDRGESVRNALERVPAEADIVVVHDAARPLVSRAIVDRTIAAVSDSGAIAAIPVTDTIKEVDAERRISGTPDRTRLWSAQTPQAFPRTLLTAAHQRAAAEGFVATDDAALVEHYGGTVRVVEGSPDNIKLTTPGDLMLARALLRCDEPGRTEPFRADDAHRAAGARRSGRGRTIVLNDTPESLDRIVRHLRAGGVIGYPTETVYGFGCLLRADALENLAVIKDRSAGNPFLILVTESVIVPGLDWNASARALAGAFWPGPLTLALRAGPDTPRTAVAADGTVAVRSSPHLVPRRIIEALREPITSTSANRAGEPPAGSAAEIVRALSGTNFPGDILVVDGGTLPASPSSTLVSFAGPRARLVRAGSIAAAEIRRIVGDLDE